MHASTSVNVTAAGLVAVTHVVAGGLFFRTSHLYAGGGAGASAGNTTDAVRVLFENWRSGLAALLAGSMLLLAFALTCRTARARSWPYFSQLVILALVVFADPLRHPSSLVFALALVLEAHLLFGALISSVLSSIVVSILVFFPRPESVWGIVTGAPAGDGALVHLFIGVLVSSLALAVHVLYDRLREQRRIADQLNGAVEQLMSANVGFQDYAYSASNQSVIDERNRITREVHDAIGYTLTNVVMMMEAAQSLVGMDEERLGRLIARTRTHAQEALRDVRRTLRSLRDARAESDSLSARLRKLVKTFGAATQVRFSVEYGNLPDDLDPDIEFVVYRTLQEALTNAFRHGHATEITVMFHLDGGELFVTVRDNGIGSTHVQEGIGLRGMRERIEPLGGRLSANTLRFGGFEVQACIPVRRRDSKGKETEHG